MIEDKKETQELNHQERIEMLSNSIYKERLARRLKYYRLGSVITYKQLVCIGLALVTLALMFIHPAFLIGTFICVLAYLWFGKVVPQSSQRLVWGYVDEVLNENGFTVDLKDKAFKNRIDYTTNQVNMQPLGEYDLQDLLDKDVDRMTTSNQAITFSTSHLRGSIYKQTAETKHTNEKGQVSYTTFFDGVVIQLEPLRIEKGWFANELGIQIKPIGKMRRLFQDTISNMSETLKDIPFGYEEMNDKMLMQIEARWFIKDKDHEKQAAQLVSKSMEEVLYRLFEQYGPYWLKIKGGKIWIALDQVVDLKEMFSKTKVLKKDYLPTYSMSSSSFDPRKWGHLMYLIGIFEGLHFHLNYHYNADSLGDRQLHSVYGDLTRNFVDVEQDEELKQWVKELDRLAKVPTFASEVMIEKMRKEIDLELENEKVEDGTDLKESSIPRVTDEDLEKVDIDLFE